MNRTRTATATLGTLAASLLLMAASMDGTASDTPAAPEQLAALVRQLGSEEWPVRDAATRQIIALGPDVASALRSELQHTTDLEVRYRLHYVLENITPPEQAVLIIRDSADRKLRSGDLVTHLNSRPITDLEQLHDGIRGSEGDFILRIRRDQTPMNVGPLQIGDLPRSLNYVLPQGAPIREALQLYREGFAERAQAIIRELDSIDPQQLTPQLRGLIAWTAGDGATARALIEPRMIQRPDGMLTWTNESGLDLEGPLQAPLHLETLHLGTLQSERTLAAGSEPDLLVQRVYVPARQFVNAAAQAADLWWGRFRAELLNGTNEPRIHGNMLAVVAWMMSDLGLVSECIELTEPRSRILGSKWIRVQADAWPDFLRNEPAAALDRYWEDARSILQNPSLPGDRRTLTRNPEIAAQVAFFLYQQPDDPRVAELLETVRRPQFPAHDAYVRWMLFSHTHLNEALLRRHLAELLLVMDDAQCFAVARALAILTYLDQQPDPQLQATVREGLIRSSDPRAEHWRTIAAALFELQAGRPDQATRLLADSPHEAGIAALRSTAAYLSGAGQGAPRDRADILLAVPLGPQAAERWITVDRDRQIVLLDRAAGTRTVLERPTGAWIPGVINWPWLGRDERSGRVWCYARRRVLELARPNGLKINIRPEQIVTFDRDVAPVFEVLANAVSRMPPLEGETGEFLRRELIANTEYVADPDLPEIGVMETLTPLDDYLHVALRGGPQLLIERGSRTAWTSLWIQEQLALAAPPLFFPIIPRGQTEPTIYLASDVGLIRFLPRVPRVTRIPLSDEQPFPSIVPESCPYDRRDPRWVYVASPPRFGGTVFRVGTTDNRVERLDITNEVLPAGYWAVRSRAEIRRMVDVAFNEVGAPLLSEFIADARRVVLEGSVNR